MEGRQNRAVNCQLKNSHVLHKDGIDSYLYQLLKQLAYILKLIIVEDGIHRDIDLRTEGMGIVTETVDVLNCITDSSTRSKTGGTYIDSIGTVVNSRNAALEILCRG